MKKGFLKIGILFLFVVLVLTGCTSAPVVQPDDTGSDTTTDVATTKTVTPAPSDKCPTKTTVTVKSTNGAYDSTLDWGTIKVSKAVKQNLIDKTNLTLMLANYPMVATSSSKLKKEELKAGEGALQFVMGQAGTGSSVAMELKEYTFGNGGDGTAKVYVPGTGKAVSFNTAQTTGGVTLTSVSGTTVCGKIDLKDNFTQITGEFVASY